ncbi:LysR family transcriptional regulator [Rhizobium sp. BR 314]|uniref:LysR family transcriptional regulator n=1 Tax=Rhizobium sp. BR 314 TaxID=3040013 RepID=UPI0039BF37C5
MDWDDLRYFVALVRCGTLSGAARLVGAEHTTVARRVAALEASLGVRLFERDAKGYSLTVEGERIVEAAYSIEDEIFGLQRQSASGPKGMIGTVRISAPPVFASSFLVPRLAPLRTSHPGIILELAGEYRAVSLSRREADIAIRMNRPEPASIIARQIGKIAYGLYGARNYLDHVAEELWTFIGYDEKLDHTPQQRWLLSIAKGRPLVFRTNDLASLRTATIAGMGLSALPRFMGDSEPTLERLPIDGSAASRDLWLAYHPDLKRSPRIRLVVDHLVDTVREYKGLLDPD